MKKYKSLIILSVFLLLFASSCSENPASSDKANRGTVTDVDGNVYNTIKIGKQWWMVENLKTSRFRNGVSIPYVADLTEWSGLSSGAYCNYKNDADNAQIYGRLYNWLAVNDDRKIAPEGWHVATDQEWKDLEMHLGMLPTDVDVSGFRGTNQGNVLMQGDFAALSGGFRTVDGHFIDIGYSAYWWTASEFCRLNSWYRGVAVENPMVSRNLDSKIFGFSVRCVKD